jgi:hypothetical protein
MAALVVAAVIITLAILSLDTVIFFILFLLKLSHQISLGWLWVFAPLWIPMAAVVVGIACFSWPWSLLYC